MPSSPPVPECLRLDWGVCWCAVVSEDKFSEMQDVESVNWRTLAWHTQAHRNRFATRSGALGGWARHPYHTQIH